MTDLSKFKPGTRLHSAGDESEYPVFYIGLNKDGKHCVQSMAGPHRVLDQEEANRLQPYTAVPRKISAALVAVAYIRPGFNYNRVDFDFFNTESDAVEAARSYIEQNVRVLGIKAVEFSFTEGDGLPFHDEKTVARG